jgi:hypothetical protein
MAFEDRTTDTGRPFPTLSYPAVSIEDTGMYLRYHAHSALGWSERTRLTNHPQCLDGVLSGLGVPADGNSARLPYEFSCHRQALGYRAPAQRRSGGPLAQPLVPPEGCGKTILGQKALLEP